MIILEVRVLTRSFSGSILFKSMKWKKCGVGPNKYVNFESFFKNSKES
jgi:hypothetical protein